MNPFDRNSTYVPDDAAWDYAIQNELTWGSGYRGYRSTTLPASPLLTKHSPINVPFKLCRALHQRPRHRRAPAPLDCDEVDHLSLLDRSALTQQQYMALIAMPRPPRPNLDEVAMRKRMRKERRRKKHCCKCKLEPCPPRLVQLAIPNKRRVLETWKAFQYIAPAEMITRYDDLLKTGRNVLDPADARFYFRKLKRAKRKALRLKRQAKLRKQREKEKGKQQWVKDQIDTMADAILDHYIDTPKYKINFQQLLISEALLDQVRTANLIKFKSRSSRNPKKKAVIEMADKVAKLIDDAKLFASVQPLKVTDEVLRVPSMEEMEEGESEYSEMEGESEEGDVYGDRYGEDDYYSKPGAGGAAARGSPADWDETDSEQEGYTTTDEDTTDLDEEGGEDELGNEGQEGVKKAKAAPGGKVGKPPASELDTFISGVDPNSLKELIEILSQSPPGVLAGELPGIPGVTYAELLGKLKEIQAGTYKGGSGRPLLEDVMVDWAKRNEPEQVNDRILKEIHETAQILGDWLQASKGIDGAAGKGQAGVGAAGGAPGGAPVGAPGGTIKEETEDELKVETGPGAAAAGGGAGAPGGGAGAPGGGAGAADGAPSGFDDSGSLTTAAGSIRPGVSDTPPNELQGGVTAGADGGAGAPGAPGAPGGGAAAAGGEAGGAPGGGAAAAAPGGAAGAAGAPGGAAGAAGAPGGAAGAPGGAAGAAGAPGGAAGAAPGGGETGAPGGGAGAGADGGGAAGVGAGGAASAAAPGGFAEGPGAVAGAPGAGAGAPGAGAGAPGEVTGAPGTGAGAPGGETGGAPGAPGAGGAEGGEGAVAGAAAGGEGAGAAPGDEGAAGETDSGAPRTAEAGAEGAEMADIDGELALGAAPILGEGASGELTPSAHEAAEPTYSPSGRLVPPSELPPGEGAPGAKRPLDASQGAVPRRPGDAGAPLEGDGCDGVIRGHKPLTTCAHDKNSICCLTLKLWAGWLLDITKNAHSWTQWVREIVAQVKHYAATVRGDVKDADGNVLVLYKEDWRRFVAETEVKMTAWREYGAHVNDVSNQIMEVAHGKEVHCCPECMRDNVIKDVCNAHETMLALCEAIKCADYWRTCFDKILTETTKFTKLDDTAIKPADVLSQDSGDSTGLYDIDELDPRQTRFSPRLRQQSPVSESDSDYEIEEYA